MIFTCSAAADPELRNGAEAVELAEYANAQRGGESCNELDTLAAAYAEVSRFDDAVATARRALDVALQTGQKDFAASIATRLELFEQGRPYRAN